MTRYGRKAGRGKGATVKERKTGIGECHLNTREGSPPPEIRAVDEMTSDYVWNKVYLHTYNSVTFYKWYIRKAHVAKAALKKAHRVMGPRVVAVSKYREKYKKSGNPYWWGPQRVPTPLCATVQIKEFLGVAGCCRNCIPDYSLLTKPF